VIVDTQEEWELILRCRNGSTAAFEPLVRAHEGRALLLAEMLLGDADDAADAVQEAFVRAYRSLGRLQPGTGFGAWFRSILRNYCVDRLRSAAHRGRVSFDDSTPGETGWTEPAGSAAIEREQFAGVVRSALGSLSPEHREILVLKEVEEMSYAEIAGAMGIPMGTVASRLYHARAALRKVALAAGLSPQGGAA
jgi:RNA polymerase sigma-70 factor, ECF subfamily